MAVPTSMAGSKLEPVVHEIDERWTMAYAAALEDGSDAYMDTTRQGGVVAHPMFAVCVEWPAIVNSRSLSIEAGVTPDEMQRSVHAWHDTIVHRLAKPGDVLSTELEIVGVESIEPGALTTTRLVTTGANGDLIATTTQGGITLGVPTRGHDQRDRADNNDLHFLPTGEPDNVEVAIPGGMAHTYTECARIWNPIHTDKAVALRSGLPDIILHGTATMALGVTQVVTHRSDGEPAAVRRILGRFGAMVLLPSTITVRVWPIATDGQGRRLVPFEVLNEEGQAAVSRGIVELGP
jgi:acyl dehydratase